MELYTRILLPKARFSFSYEDRVVMMGSCFAENIGRKLEENKFSVGRRMPRPYKQPLIPIFRFPAESDPVGNHVGNRFRLPPQERRANRVELP